MPIRSGPRSVLDPLRPAALGLMLALAGCVTEDAATGRNVPRGNQRYEFEQVERAAEHLREGLTRAQVLALLGSAAQVEEDGELWIWLPERLGLLVPARSLHVRFRDGLVIEHGFRPIVFGATL